MEFKRVKGKVEDGKNVAVQGVIRSLVNVRGLRLDSAKMLH